MDRANRTGHHLSRRYYRRSEAWETLLSELSERAWKNFTRFAGWCTSHGVEPDDVTEGAFARFLDELLTLRGAAMLELLHMPVQMRNVVGLDLERHVQRMHEEEGHRRHAFLFGRA